VASCYLPRWKIFIEYLDEVHSAESYNATELHERLLGFEEGWQGEPSPAPATGSTSSGKEKRGTQSLEEVLNQAYEEWKEVFEG